MRLQPPQSTPSPTYPERRAGLFRVAGRWIRRVGAVATTVAAASFWVCGCFGITEGGAAPGPDYWVCTDEPNDPVDVTYPGVFSGSICEDRTSWGDLEVTEQVTLRFSFDPESLSTPGRRHRGVRGCLLSLSSISAPCLIGEPPIQGIATISLMPTC